MDTVGQKIIGATGPGDCRAVADEQIFRLLRQVALSHATELARCGRYTAAELVLSELLGAEVLPAPLDLLARIRAQQGRLTEARDLWERVLRLVPSDAAALAGLARIQHLEICRAQKQTTDAKGKDRG